MVRENLIGAWRLISFGRMTVQGEFEPVFGEQPSGFLIYSDDGHMSAIITKEERPLFASDDLTGGAPGEKQSAFDTCISYAGRFEIKGDIVCHHIEASLFPNWIASDQRRLITFDGDELILSSQPILTDGVGWVYQARWRRAARADAMASANQGVQEMAAL